MRRKWNNSIIETVIDNHFNGDSYLIFPFLFGMMTKKDCVFLHGRKTQAEIQYVGQKY